MLLEKDATAAVVAELWFAEPGASRDFAFMYYGTGLPPTSLDAADAVDSAFRRLAALASSGDPRATAILTDAARAIVVIVNLLDIDQVIFGGPFWLPIAPTVLAALPAAVRDDPALVLPHPIRFAESAVPVDVAAVGAATLVLDNTFSPRPSALLLAAD